MNQEITRREEVEIATLLGIVQVIHGDGKHDDTEALQSLLDGNNVYNPKGELMTWSDVNIASPKYFMSKPLKFNRSRIVNLEAKTRLKLAY